MSDLAFKDMRLDTALPSESVRPRHAVDYWTSASGLPIAWKDALPVPPEFSGERRWYLGLKRIIDIVLSGLALAALAPLFLIVAIAVKATSKGPVFFKQTREGIGGSEFLCFKFRSMAENACDPTGVAQTVRNDSRVTPIGRFIRKTSIDELPQLINVWRGDMSLVGPRPHVRGMRAGGIDYTTLVPYYSRRLDVLPGLTGWAQCNGLRGPTDDAELAKARIDHDVAYCQNLSLWLDLKILALTVKNEFLGGSGI